MAKTIIQIPFVLKVLGWFLVFMVAKQNHFSVRNRYVQMKINDAELGDR